MFVETTLYPLGCADQIKFTTLINLEAIELAEPSGKETIVSISGKKYVTSLNYERLKSFVPLYLAKD